MTCRSCTGTTWHIDAVCDRCRQRQADQHLPIYNATGPVLHGVELTTGRRACCGAGTDQRDDRTGERLHLLGCPAVAATGLVACRDALDEIAAVAQ